MQKLAHLRQMGRMLFGRSGVLVGILVLVVFFSFSTPYFFDFQNFVNIAQQTTILAVAAFAMTFIILAGEIDLSIGSVASLIGILVAMSLRDGYPMPVAVMFGLVFGAVSGLINGAITVLGRVPSFIVTLGMFSAARGIAYAITNARAISVNDPNFLDLFARLSPLGVSATIWYALVSFLALHLLLTRTSFGMLVYAVGGNANAAHYSGINVRCVKLGVFVVAGILTGLTAILLTARLGTGFVEGARNLELDAIAAVVLGGTSFSGGRGSLVRTLFGALLIGILNNGMSLLNIGSYFQLVIKGLIVITAVLLDRWVADRSA